MGITTSIEWCDSTANLEMGCDGCELWNGRDRKECYAGGLVNFHAGNPGWPESFDQPKLFPHRLAEILKWKDLTGTERPDKPWLNGLPRVVFLDDLGDTFTPSLPKDWLAEHLPALGASPHIYILLTKQAREMAEFSQRYPLPENFWPGVSVTSQDFAWRINQLFRVNGGSVRIVSAEPLHGPLDLTAVPTGKGVGEEYDPLVTMNVFSRASVFAPRVGWLIIGGSSGLQAPPCELAWIRNLARQGGEAGTATFIKQVGSKPVFSYPDSTMPAFREGEFVHLKDRKGGDPAEWPEDLRVRQMPAWKGAACQAR